MFKVIIIASGKGGTGKTTLSAGVAAALAVLGRRVLVVDGDSGLRNLDIVLGMSDRVVFSFLDVALGTVPLRRAAVGHPRIEQLYMLTAPTAPLDAAVMTASSVSDLAKQAKDEGYEYVVIDGPAGLSQEIRIFSSIATQAIVVSTPDGACIRGAERMARELENNGVNRIRLVVNRIRTRLIKHGLASDIDDAMDATGLPLLGLVPEDEDVIACANSGRSVISVKRDGASRAYMNIAKRIEGQKLPLMRV